MASAEESLPSFKPGQVVTFKGYSDASVEPIFQPGEQLRIEKVNALDGGLVTVRLDGSVGDTVFPEEVEVQYTEAEVAEQAKEVALKVAAASTKIARKTDKPAKGKAKVKTPAKVTAKAPAKTAAKAPAKAAVQLAKVDRTKEPNRASERKAVQAKPEPVKTAKVTPIRAKGKATRDAKTVDFVDEKATPTLRPEVAAKVESTAVEQPWEEPATANVPAVVVSTVVTEGGITVTDSERVAAILAGQDALDAAKALVAQTEETYFTLGGVLTHIYNEGIHKTLGYDGKRGFEAYVEKELGVAYRKAMYLIDIYTAFRAVGFDERRLTQIGWSKAKELTRFINPDNVDVLVEAAATKSREELVTHLRETMAQAEGGTTGEQARRVKIGFALFADQAETVTRALDEAKAKVGNDNINQALEYICAEWLMTAEGVEMPLEDAIRQIEAKYGVRLVPQSAAVEDAGERVAATA